MAPAFDTIAVIGVGLIGGSIGIAARRRGLARRVVGVGRRQISLDAALQVGAADEVTLDIAQGVREADLVVIATPISAIAQVAAAAAQGMKQGAVLTDVASTKQTVIKTVTAALAERSDVVFIPTHPMAGSEQRGPQHAREDLFEGSVCFFTPLDGTPQGELDRLRALWEGLGAAVHVLDAAAHDRIVSRISHLPHLAAAALVRSVTGEEAAFAGGGLTDTTRIASGDPALWRDICESNAEDVARALKDFAGVIGEMRAMVADGRFDELQDLLRAAKDKRDGLLRD